MFVILTDGLTDVFNTRAEEFGLDRIKAIIREHAAAPLKTLQTRLLDAVKAYGPQLDDQTVLLIRAADV